MRFRSMLDRSLLPLLLLCAGLAHGQNFSATATPPSLHEAIAAGDATRLERLLRDGADLEEREPHGRTPLYAAARAGRTDLALALLRAGAQPSARNYAGITPLHAAAAGNHPDLVRVLVANCAEVDARDLQQRTPLFLAAARGSREVADILLANGADLRAKLKGGSTPLAIAVSFRQQDIAQLLRERLAEIPPEGSAPAGADATPRPRGDAERIQFVQQKLRELGYQPGAVDGQLADGTRRAIQSFQKEIGQVVSGKLSPCLIERIAKEVEIRQRRAASPSQAPAAASQLTSSGG